MKVLIPLLGVLALAACSPPVPDSAAGVGFGDYGSYQQRQAALAKPKPQEETAQVATPQPTDDIAKAALAVPKPTTQVAEARPEFNNPTISDEQDFEAVAARETIQSDAERRKKQAEQYQVAQVKTVPDRNNTLGPNIVEYALATSNPVGNKIYSRVRLFGGNSNARNCASHGSPDIAQEAFLAAGGPRKDRQNLDPDGDGYACGWDPEPYRAAVKN